MYQMWIHHHSDRDGKHSSLFAVEKSIEALRKRLIDQLRIPEHYWGFGQKSRLTITKVGFSEIVEVVHVIDYCRAIGIYLHSDNGVN